MAPRARRLAHQGVRWHRHVQGIRVECEPQQTDLLAPNSSWPLPLTPRPGHGRYQPMYADHSVETWPDELQDHWPQHARSAAAMSGPPLGRLEFVPPWRQLHRPSAARHNWVGRVEGRSLIAPHVGQDGVLPASFDGRCSGTAVVVGESRPAPGSPFGETSRQSVLVVIDTTVLLAANDSEPR
jgi:hypothetical protein